MCGGAASPASAPSSLCYSRPAAASSQGWAAAPPLLANASHAAAASLGDTMYVFGGRRSAPCDPRTQVQVLRPRAPAWAFLPALPPDSLGGRSCAVAAGRFIFVIGGRAERCGGGGGEAGPSAGVLILDTASASWSRGPALLTARSGHGCTLVDVAGRHVRSAFTFKFEALLSIPVCRVSWWRAAPPPPRGTSPPRSSWTWARASPRCCRGTSCGGAACPA